MKIAFVQHFYDPGMAPETMIENHFSTVQLMQKLVEESLVPHVFYRFDKDYFFEKNGVAYHFIKDTKAPYPKPWHRYASYNHKVGMSCKEQGIALVHAHNQNRPLMHYGLMNQLPNTPYLIQDHGGAFDLRYRWLMRRYLKKVDYLLLAAKGMEEGLVGKGIFRKDQIKFIMEAASEFSPVDKPSVSLEGAPVFLWVGNLDDNKDPLTVIKAFKNVHTLNPQARLHMLYKHSFLEKDIKDYIHTHQLIDTVKLHGFVDRKHMDQYFSVADYFVAASHKEGSGYALLESLSCGVTPILTKIPSFIELTKDAKIGALYPVGDIDELTKLMEEACQKNPNRNEVLDFYENHFSYPVLAKEMKKLYLEAIASKRNKKAL